MICYNLFWKNFHKSSYLKLAHYKSIIIVKICRFIDNKYKITLDIIVNYLKKLGY